jgi:hypothetical protein
MISHPDFIETLVPLVNARQAQGFAVKVVDVLDIYSQFSHGIFDPQAIRDYIAYARNNMGISYVLLVGGDTYDYLDYLGTGVKSFIPTLYAATDEMVNFAPVDPLYAELNGDGLPDLALGRMPVSTTTELEVLIAKTLAYENKDYNKTAVFSADLYYKNYSDFLLARLATDWTVQKAYLDYMPVADARAILLGQINSGVALTNYFGHSTSEQWTYSGLLTTNDAANLTNAGRPTVVAQYGCWNTYFVDPEQDSLGHKFLLSGDRGAAAVLGSTTLNYTLSQQKFGAELTDKLSTPGLTIGEAMRSAKQVLYGTRPWYTEIYMGWTIMGDPTLVIQP